MHFIVTVRVALRGFGEVTSICFYSVAAAHRPIVTNRVEQISGYVYVQFFTVSCPENLNKLVFGKLIFYNEIQ